MEGNNKAMRDALESFMVGSCVYPCVGSCGYDPIDEICMRCAASPEKDGDCPYEKARKALAAPPRNCDVGTPEEQFDRFAKHCIGKDCGSCEHGDGVRGRSLAHCALRWAQTPCEAKEGAGE